MKKGKLVRVWGKIKLLETSAVGIPAYPAAHKSNKSRSLVNALEKAAPKDELNYGESPMEEDTPVEGESESEVSEQPVAEPETEVEAEAEEAKPEAEVEKGVSKEEMMDMMTKGFEAAIKASATPRGLVASEATAAEKAMENVKGMSLGDLAIMNGVGKAPDMYGRV